MYKITRCLDLVVRNEKQHERTMPGKCYHCQRYGYSQAYCKMQLRCVRCVQEHRAADSGKTRKEPAICTLCAKAHLPQNQKWLLQWHRRESPPLWQDRSKRLQYQIQGEWVPLSSCQWSLLGTQKIIYRMSIKLTKGNRRPIEIYTV